MLEDLKTWWTALDSIHKNASNLYIKKLDNDTKKICEDIAYVRDDIAKKIEITPE